MFRLEHNPTSCREPTLRVEALYLLFRVVLEQLSFYFQDKFNDFEDAVEMSASVFFSMKDIPNMLQDPANPKVRFKGPLLWDGCHIT